MFCKKKNNIFVFLFYRAQKIKDVKKEMPTKKVDNVAAREHKISRNKNVWNDKNLRQD